MYGNIFISSGLLLGILSSNLIFFLQFLVLYLKVKLIDSYMQLTYLKPEVRFSSVILNFNKGALHGKLPAATYGYLILQFF